MIALADVETLCQRWFGAGPEDVEPLTIGTYNETMRVRLSSGDTIILRVGPAGDEGIDNGAEALVHASALGDLVPRTLALDSWGDRRVTAQSVLPGSPASARVPDFNDRQSRVYYRDLGRVTRLIHDVRGESFGSVLHPGESSWADAVTHRLEERISEFDDASVDSRELRILLAAVPAVREQLDRAEPCLLHGDLWSLNILLRENDTISGIVDWDAASWGDPVADWTIHRIRQRAGTVADAFWETYGELPEHSESRSIYAAALNTSGSRLDIERRHLVLAEIPPEHWDLVPIVAALESLGLQ